MRIAVLTAGSQERLWLQNLLAQTPYRREIFELAAPDLPGQPTRFEVSPDLLILSEGAAPPHLFSRLLRELPPQSGVLVITSDPGSYHALLAQSGRRGWGILGPAISPPQIQAAIAAVLQGLRIVQPSEEEERLAEPLTPREQEIAALLAQGLTNKEIARRLHLSENTVKTHITAVYGKAGVNNRAELVALAARLGWIAI